MFAHSDFLLLPRRRAACDAWDNPQAVIGVNFGLQPIQKTDVLIA
jgi:hypothetical protein